MRTRRSFLRFMVALTGLPLLNRLTAAAPSARIVDNTEPAPTAAPAVMGVDVAALAGSYTVVMLMQLHQNGMISDLHCFQHLDAEWSLADDAGGRLS